MIYYIAYYVEFKKRGTTTKLMGVYNNLPKAKNYIFETAKKRQQELLVSVEDIEWSVENFGQSEDYLESAYYEIVETEMNAELWQ